MQAAASQCTHLLTQYDRLLDGLDDTHRALAQVAGGKTAGWLIGHLVITGDFGRRLCGQPPLSPREWRATFAPGTQPSTDPATYPPMATMVDRFRAIYADLAAHAAETPAEVLAAPNPFEPTRGTFPTAGSFVEYLLTSHLAYHLGQLSGWRASPPQAPPPG
jgi:hypothetical protein